MKNIKYLLTIIILGTIFLTACQKNDPILFKNSDSFVAFTSSSASVGEATIIAGVPVENTINILVMVASLNSTPLTVTFDFDIVGIANPAVEGEAFTLLNASKTLSFPNGWGYDTIKIRTIDDDIFTANRSVNIKLLTNSAGYDFGAESELRLTIVDDEHPLAIVLGTFDVTWESNRWGDAGTTITTRAVDGTITQVQFNTSEFAIDWGIPASHVILADVDLDEMTFEIKSGQSWASFGYGPYKLIGRDGSTGIDMDDGEFVRGTIDADGNITLTDWVLFVIYSGPNTGYVLDRIEPEIIWIKSDDKKSTELNEAPVKIKRTIRSL